MCAGLVITHGHEDHIGAIQHVIDQINVPIYATPLTRGLLEGKLSRNNAQHKAQFKTIQAGESSKIGPFQIEYFHVSHSIPDAVGLGITTPAGLVIHISDFKFDHTPVDGWPTDFAKLSEFSTRGVDLLLSDSTNAERPGWTPSESVIGPAFDKVFSEAKGRVIGALGARRVRSCGRSSTEIPGSCKVMREFPAPEASRNAQVGYAPSPSHGRHTTGHVHILYGGVWCTAFTVPREPDPNRRTR